jgi:hypothetical protein
VIALDPLRPGL